MVTNRYFDKGNVLVIPDLHLRAKNFENRKNYIREIFSYIDAIILICKANDVKIVIFLGDILDNDFVDKYAVQIQNRFISKMLKLKSMGIEIYTLMGNHELHNIRRNSSNVIEGNCPFFSLVDLESDRIKAELSAINFTIEETMGILTAPDTLMINDRIRFEFFHFSDINKAYTDERGNEKTLIGLYHDALVSSFIKNIIGEMSFKGICDRMHTIDCDSIGIFSNVDYANIGDIHTKVGEFKVGNCICDMPGSIGRTAYTPLQSHEEIYLPMYVIDGENVTKERIRFPLWKIADSFKVDVLENNKLEYQDNKAFKKALTKTYVTRDLVDDINNASVSDNIKSICLSAVRKEKIYLDSINHAVEYLDKNRVI